ncbi:MAG: NERD domain-containing protein/DEAD/DEAH box helicase [Gammaproteobacteria bacterium]|nr:NERD domain-containing protein/DEAD/DEAH box helicase [Gammaproteobacteria bacterium]
MARLIPRIEIPDIALKPERDVARALTEQLPDHVTILHSYPWLRAQRNDQPAKVTLQEGEADFLVFWPDRGLLVIEVKGGIIEYDADSRRWNRVVRDQTREIRDPFEQARRNSYHIINLIRRQVYGGGPPPFSYGYAVFFPDCVYHGAMPPGAEAAITLSATDLGHVPDRIAKALKRWSRTGSPPVLGKGEAARVMRAILPAFNLLPVLFRAIEEQEELLVRMTEEQLRLLVFLGNNKRVAIEGVAGSGKTMLAKRQVEKFAAGGKKSLFLCYNRRLADWLKQGIPQELSDLVHVSHFHGLCHDWCVRAGIRFSPSPVNRQAFWDEEAANLLCEAIEVLPERYECIVVDEAQDFCPDWWVPLEMLNAEEDQGVLYVFYDPAQNLYHREGNPFPVLGDPFHLPTNCRNTKSIAGTCSTILDSKIRVHPHAPAGLETEVVIEPDHRVPGLLDAWIRKWTLADKILPGQIVVLSRSRFDRSCLQGVESLGGTDLVHDPVQWRGGAGVLFSTIRSFKGLESDIVILVDLVVPDSKMNFTRSDFYVACSRAKHVLKIISEKEIGLLQA